MKFMFVDMVTVVAACWPTLRHFQFAAACVFLFSKNAKQTDSVRMSKDEHQSLCNLFSHKSTDRLI